MAVVEVKRLFVFGTAGTLNTVVCYVLFAALVQSGCHYNVALGADYAFGAALGYVLHRMSTFADRKHSPGSFRKYVLTLAATFLVNLALLDALITFGVLRPLGAQLVAMSVSTLASYAAQKHWVFRAAISNPATR